MPGHVSQPDLEAQRAADMAAVEEQAAHDRQRAEAKATADAIHEQHGLQILALQARATGLENRATAAEGRLAALEAKVAGLRSAEGTATVATGLVGGGTRTVTVALAPGMATAGYRLLAWIEGGATVLGALRATPLTTGRTATTCQVEVANTSLLTLATTATLRVVAIPA